MIFVLLILVFYTCWDLFGVIGVAVLSYGLICKKPDEKHFTRYMEKSCFPNRKPICGKIAFVAINNLSKITFDDYVIFKIAKISCGNEEIRCMGITNIWGRI